MFSGAAIGIWYASVFPDDVGRLISFDMVNIGPVTLDQQVEHTANAIKEVVKILKILSPVAGSPPKEPAYAYIDAVARYFLPFFGNSAR